VEQENYEHQIVKPTGRNPYFILVPGYQLVLEGQEDGEEMHVEITVLKNIAMDRGENIGMGLTVETLAGVFDNCVEVLETTPLDLEEESTKVYCPGVGLVVDEELELVDCGFVSSCAAN